MCIDDIGRLLYGEATCRVTAHGFPSTLEKFVTNLEIVDPGHFRSQILCAPHHPVRYCQLIERLGALVRSTQKVGDFPEDSVKRPKSVSPWRRANARRDPSGSIVSVKVNPLSGSRGQSHMTAMLPQSEHGWCDRFPSRPLSQGAKKDSDHQARGRPAWPTTAGWQDVDKSVR